MHENRSILPVKIPWIWAKNAVLGRFDPANYGRITVYTDYLRPHKALLTVIRYEHIITYHIITLSENFSDTTRLALGS